MEGFSQSRKKRFQLVKDNSTLTIFDPYFDMEAYGERLLEEIIVSQVLLNIKLFFLIFIGWELNSP